MVAALGAKSEVGSSNGTLQSGPRLLRKPRAPAPLKQLPVSPPPKSITSALSQYSFNERLSPLPSLHPSVVSPPPPSELHSHNQYDSFSGGSISRGRKTGLSSVLRKGDLPYVLDPVFREKTQLGTYVEGQSLIKPYKCRGPQGMPARLPKQHPPLLHVALDEEDERFFSEPPMFTLRDFMLHISETQRMPLQKVKEAMFSKHNYKKMQNIIAANMSQKQSKVKQIDLTPSDDMPHTTPRVPQQQLLLEMASIVKNQMSEVMQTEMRSVIRKLPKYSPSYKPGHAPPHTEILLYEADTTSKKENGGAGGARSYSMHEEGGEEEDEMPPAVTDNMFHASNAKYFQGAKRSASPFSMPEDNVISPAELAVLDAMMSGGYALSLKANFIDDLPQMQSLTKTLTYLNLSFNDFRSLPYEIFSLKQLTVLKFRNCPIKEIPPDIGHLTNLKALVFPFCMVSSLPPSLFTLPNLTRLDMAYNKLSFLPNEIRNLRLLSELNVEGNQIAALPSGALRLENLRWLRIMNNLMHPLFWAENSQNRPQRLLDMACSTFHNHNLLDRYAALPDSVLLQINDYTICECCMGPMYGAGLRVIRPVSRLFGIKNVPILFRACSAQCKTSFMMNTESVSDLVYGEDLSSQDQYDQDEL